MDKSLYRSFGNQIFQKMNSIN